MHLILSVYEICYFGFLLLNKVCVLFELTLFGVSPNQISAGYSGRSFYGSHSADQHWQPGETIPTYVPESPIPNSPIATSTPTQHHHTIFPTFSPHPPQNKDIMDMLQKFQSSVETQLASVSSSLSSVSTQITELESQHWREK